MDHPKIDHITSVLREILGEGNLGISEVSYFETYYVSNVIEVLEPRNFITFTDSGAQINIRNLNWTHYNYDESTNGGDKNIIGIKSEDLNFDIVLKNGGSRGPLRRFTGRIHAYVKEEDKTLQSFCIIKESKITNWSPFNADFNGNIMFTKNGGLTKGVR